MSTAKISKPPRIRRSPEAARDNILAAAERVLVERGPQALKLADVAAEAGIANASVLHHFGSIDDVQAALMEKMVRELVANILAVPEATGEGIQTLFDTFESPAVSRLAAWLELTGEARRLTMVRKAVNEVVARVSAHSGMSEEKAENAVMVSLLLAMGVGLFGRSLATLMGRPAKSTRDLAIEMLLKHQTEAKP
ncbi:MAG TPA: TetR/AcrR family transcriptional regulator [Verrucomicrobiae bacterium]|jgi:AcrR family transcriptional regulator|nr:TetR/AcrR family transcriptional regulator [Verrucomicrobiae bacterium]